MSLYWGKAILCLGIILGINACTPMLSNKESRTSNNVEEDLSDKYKLPPLSSIDQKSLQKALHLFDRGTLYLAKGQSVEALERFKQALTIRERILGNHPSVMIIYTTIVIIYLNQKEYDQALTLAKKALILNKSIWGENHPTLSLNYHYIGMIYLSKGNNLQALDYFKRQLSIATKKGKHFAYSNVGAVYEAQGNYTQALIFFKKALAIYKKELHENNDWATMAYLYDDIGKAYRVQGNYKQAFIFAKKAFIAFSRFQRADFEFSIEIMRHQNQSHQPLVHEFFVAATDYLHMLQQQKHTETKKLMKTIADDWFSYKGSILENENRLLSFAQTSQDPMVQKQYQKLIQLKQNYAKLAQLPPEALTQHAQYQDSLQQQEQKIARLQYAIAQKNSYFKQENALQTVTTEKITQQLPSNALYLDYARVGDRYFIIAMTKNKLELAIVNVDMAKQINQEVKVFREHIADIKDTVSRPEDIVVASRQTLANLYPLLLPQKIQAIMADKTELIISPDGALNLLPFEALYDTQAGQYLIQQKTVRYIASGKELMRVLSRQSRSAHSARHAVLFSHPDFNQSNVKALPQNAIHRAVLNTPQLKRTFVSVTLDQPVGELPNTAREAQQIQQTLHPINVRSLSRRQASEANLLQTRQPTILHIATHGFFNDSNPNPMLQSGLLLAGANQSIKQKTDTGIVSALKLSGMDLEGTDLVVLSACDTGTVNPDATEGVSGLTKAFIQAGAQKVVMSLWAVRDKETADLMIQFYKNSGNDPNAYARAFRASKIAMIEKELHPYYWAAFVLSGL